MVSDSPLKLSSALVFVSVLLPRLVLDYYNVRELYFSSSGLYLLSKITIWFLLPLLMIYSVQRIIGKRATLSFLLAFYLLLCPFFYGEPTWIAFLTSGIVAASWQSLHQVITKATPFLLLLAAILLAITTRQVIEFAPLPKPPRTTNSLQQAEKAPLPSLYLILFDELSREAVFSQEKVRESLPSFMALSEQSLVPAAATTNFDTTAQSVPSLLSGTLLEQCDPFSADGCYSLEGLLTLSDQRKLSAWGPAPEPLCRALRKRSSDAYCFDGLDQLGHLPWQQVIGNEIKQFLFVYVFNLPTRLIAFLGSETPWLSHYFSFVRSLEHVDWNWVHLHEAERFQDFISRIGKVPGGIYFYHSYLPHYPYISFSKTEFSAKFHNAAFHYATSEKSFRRTQERYEENVQRADRLLGEILQTIQKRDPEGLVIVTSDHGAAFRSGLENQRYQGKPFREVAEIPFFFFPSFSLFCFIPSRHWPISILEVGVLFSNSYLGGWLVLP